jgi:adenine C2-methylase RlmN of 23S rRNA A2503 and tRNA A37
MNNSIRVTFHHALIKHENSNLTDAKEFVSVLRQHDIVGARFNLVRYNPHSSAQGEEASDKQIMNYLSVLTDSGIFSNIKTIPKVGLDIAAACGMFIQTK